MNYPGVALGDEGMLDKIALFKHLVLDGHAPNMSGAMLNAYVAAGVQSEHECTTVAEALEKLRLGLTIFVREGTTTRNLEPLLPLITPENHAAICFCTDDRIPADLIDQGSIDYMIRVAIGAGIDPLMALRMGSLNTARHFGLKKHGAVAPGKYADLLVIADLAEFMPEQVYRGGDLVAQDGAHGRRSSSAAPRRHGKYSKYRGGSAGFQNTGAGRAYPGHRNDTGPSGYRAPGGAGKDPCWLRSQRCRAGHIEDRYGRAPRGKWQHRSRIHQGVRLAERRHRGTVAHDHHNLAVIGVDDISMKTAVRAP